jgi:hypothetical protein
MLKIISISDIHLGNKIVKSEFIINNLNKYFSCSKELSDIDIIFLCGDIFDSGIYLPDTHTGAIQRWIVRVLHLCKKWNICLRVLEGTPSHDRKQSKQFEILNDLFGIEADIKYIDKLSIEYIERFDINVLYLPDEWRGCVKDTENEVKELLQINNIMQVDYAVMHGNFEYQLPMINSLSAHESLFYLSIVKKYIFIGHIHNMSQSNRILAQGSFDRLAHNEEHNKGFFYIESHKDSFIEDKIVFKVNHSAAIFTTLNLINLTKTQIEQLINATLSDHVAKHHTQLHIRLLIAKDDINESLINGYKRIFHTVHWRIKIIRQHLDDEKTNILIPELYKPLQINENTIISIIKTRLEDKGINESLINKTINKLIVIKNL